MRSRSGQALPLKTGEGAEAIAPGIWLLHGQGQSFVAETSAGLVVVDAGPGGKVTAAMIEALRRFRCDHQKFEELRHRCACAEHREVLREHFDGMKKAKKAGRK